MLQRGGASRSVVRRIRQGKAGNGLRKRRDRDCFHRRFPRAARETGPGSDVGEVFELARELGKHVSVKLALNSKSQRGYDLLDNKGVEAAHADKIELRHGMSPVEAFLVIGRSILRHIAANESAVRRSDPEGVHQMRVGLRRLRGAMRGRQIKSLARSEPASSCYFLHKFWRPHKCRTL